MDKRKLILLLLIGISLPFLISFLLQTPTQEKVIEEKQETVIEINEENETYGLDSDKNKELKVAKDSYEYIETDTLYQGQGNNVIEDKAFSNKDFDNPITEAYKYGLSSSGQFYLSAKVGETAEEIIVICHKY